MLYRFSIECAGRKIDEATGWPEFVQWEAAEFVQVQTETVLKPLKGVIA
jgi:hypothetical protein